MQKTVQSKLLENVLPFWIFLVERSIKYCKNIKKKNQIWFIIEKCEQEDS